MNWSLVKKDFMLLPKSPLTYIGVLSMVVILYITVSACSRSVSLHCRAHFQR